eukprot:scaffold80118_cov45-Prasinocladus_malaysianus.AAC.2
MRVFGRDAPHPRACSHVRRNGQCAELSGHVCQGPQPDHGGQPADRLQARLRGGPQPAQEADDQVDGELRPGHPDEDAPEDEAQHEAGARREAQETLPGPHETQTRAAAQRLWIPVLHSHGPPQDPKGVCKE